MRCILGSGGQIIHHNPTIWVPNESLGLFALSFSGLNIARICAGLFHVKISWKIGKKIWNFFWNFFLLIKKSEIKKSKTTLNISVLKVEITKMVLVYSIANFFTNKNLRGKSNFCQKMYLFFQLFLKFLDILTIFMTF